MAAIPQFRPSHRGSTPSIAEQLQTRARTVEAKGQKVIYLQVGQPSSGAPADTLEAVEKAGRDSRPWATRPPRTTWPSANV